MFEINNPKGTIYDYCILLPKGINELNIVEILLQSVLFSFTKR
jgi:hypothetical protein